MLPTLKEQENKIVEILKTSKGLWKSPITDEMYDLGITKRILGSEEASLVICKEYAKWYAEQVINHCAKVAKIAEIPCSCGNCSNTETGIDKQSILTVINEL